MKERDEVRLVRNAKKAGDFYIPPEPKLAFIIRIRGFVAIFFIDILNLVIYLFIIIFQCESSSSQSKESIAVVQITSNQQWNIP